MHVVKEEKNILHPLKRRKGNCSDHLLHRDCLLKHIIEGKMEETERHGKRCKQLMNGLKEKRRYWNFNEEALDCTL